MGREVKGREVKRVAANTQFPPAKKTKKPRPGKWFQMWQTVSDEPYSPAFETAEELAMWCSKNPWGMERDNPIPYETWLKFINGPGHALSMMGMAGSVTSGVEFVVDQDGKIIPDRLK